MAIEYFKPDSVQVVWYVSLLSNEYHILIATLFV